jgi:hypothetical protein
MPRMVKNVCADTGEHCKACRARPAAIWSVLYCDCACHRGWWKFWKRQEAARERA